MPDPKRYPGVHKRHTLTCSQVGDESTCGCPWSYTAERIVRGQRSRSARSGFPSKTAAHRAREAWLRDESGDARGKARNTVAVHARQWLADRTTGTAELEPLRPTTLISYRRYVDYLIDYMGDVKLADVKPADVRAFREWLRRERPNMKLSTQDRVYATVRVFLRDCFDDELIAVDPTVRRQQRKRKGTKRKRSTVSTLEPEQFARLLTWLYARDERLAPVIAFAGLTGLRRGEVAGLSWLDVNMGRGVVTVRQQLLDVGGELDLYEPKTSAGAGRRVDVDAVVLEVLRDQQRRQALDRAAFGTAYQDAGIVFTRADGSALNPMTLTKSFPRLVRAYNGEQTDPALRLPVLTFHSLRHHAASAALAGGTDLAIVSKRLGHSAIAVTSDFYSHLVAGAGRQAAEATSRVVGWRLSDASPQLPHIPAPIRTNGSADAAVHPE